MNLINEIDFSKKNIKFLKYKTNNLNFINKIFYNLKFFKVLCLLFIYIFIIISIVNNLFESYNKFNNLKPNTSFNINKYNKDFNFAEYENHIITNKMKQKASWILSMNEVNFFNGIIRKYKPKYCLEIGVAQGGSSILLLNAIQDIQNSILISIDLNKKVYNDPTKNTGYRVNEYFPELSKKWKLFTGDQPHKFLVKLKMKFDFVFLDSSHFAPGELINFIEVLPFLNQNCIIVFHDIIWHFTKKNKIYPSNIVLYPAIYGDKIPLITNNGYIDNIGAVFLYNCQENHYLDYFLLLLNFWEYMPSDNQIKDLIKFIKKYYKRKIYLKIFETAVKKNRISIENHNKSY